MRRRRSEGPATTVNMSDVAARAGVSAQTVSRALGKPELVSEETRRKIHETIRELGYIPNEAARNLASSRTRTVAVVIPTLASSAYSAQVGEIIKTFEHRGISVVIGNTEYSLQREEQIVRSLLERRPLAFILTGLHHSGGTRQMLRAAGIPVIETWDLDGEPIDRAVGFSNIEAGKEVGRLLARRGVKLAAFVGGNAVQDPRATSRYKGMAQAMTEAGLPMPLRVEMDLPMTTAEGIVGLDNVLSEQPMTEAILFSADFLAIGALLECNRRGIRIPEQLAICGFGDYELAPLVTPALTTVKIYPDLIGKHAAETILRELDGEGPSERKHDIGHRLIRRGSA
ncbi:LacI family DNA-binding transcriptional regulator [Mesorhizobium sp. GR13]|uniref:LacI family DNA-binding transcriptional regulator n=1 Tax=Mesorhizobium sp. GR13 TaxID=2562308 RepID=UPI0010C02A39|nr:LacI family DNA-binding transcriptional regulator [Mesorhizobium sp. GR13]